MSKVMDDFRKKVTERVTKEISERIAKEVTKEVTERVIKEVRYKVAIKLIKNKKNSLEEIVEITELPLEEVKMIATENFA